MDILGKYEAEQPRVVPQVLHERVTEYGFFVRLVMRLSSGRITDARQATYLLLIVAVIFVLAALVILFAGSGSDVPPSPPTPFQEEKSKTL